MAQDIMALVDELEGIVHDAKSALGRPTSKIVDENDMYAIIDDMRAAIPEEVRQARLIIRERAEMLEAAEAEANRILEDAKNQAIVIASEQEIVRIAEQRAAAVLEQARETEREMRYGAEDYADEIFAHLEENLATVSGAVARCRERFSNKYRSSR